MYAVAKMSATSRRLDDYEYHLEYRTWRELTADLAKRSKHANAVFVGRGAAILRDGECIGHTRTLELGGTPIGEITLSEFRERQAEEDSPVPSAEECGLAK